MSTLPNAISAFSISIGLVILSDRASAGQGRASNIADEANVDRDRARYGAFAGVGFPRPLSLEAMVKFERMFGVGVEYSVLPKQSIAGVEATLWAVAVDARFFPFKDGFFIGISAGHQSLRASASTVVTGPLGISAESWFLNPRMGFLVTWRSGLTLGIDVGVQLPVSASFSSNVPMVHPIAKDVVDTARLFGQGVLPTIDLMRLGLML